jgi:hypothetical protein
MKERNETRRRGTPRNARGRFYGVMYLSAPHVFNDETDLGAYFRLSFCAQARLFLSCLGKSVGTG